MHGLDDRYSIHEEGYSLERVWYIGSHEPSDIPMDRIIITSTNNSVVQDPKIKRIVVLVSLRIEINVGVQYNGGLLPDIILSTRCSYIGEPF